MDGQISLFDQPEAEVGSFQTHCGAAIPHIMRPAYIGKPVLIDVHTQSQKPLYQVGILENYIRYEGRWRAIVYTGKKQRQLVTMYPGIELHELEPIDRIELSRRILR